MSIVTSNGRYLTVIGQRLPVTQPQIYVFACNIRLFSIVNREISHGSHPLRITNMSLAQNVADLESKAIINTILIRMSLVF